MNRALIAAPLAALFFAIPAWAQQSDHEKHHPGEPPAAAAPAPGGVVKGPVKASAGMMGCPMMAGGMMGQGTMGPGMMERGMPRGGMMGPGMMGQGMGPGAMFEGLDLPDEQQAKLRKIHDELRDRNWASMGQMMKEGNRMRELFAAPTLDRAAAEAAHRRMSALREQMFMAQLDAHAQVEALLAPDQRVKLRQRMHGRGMMMH